MFYDNIILTGPLATGKSTIALRLSELTGKKNIPIDRLKWYYRFINGYNLAEGTEILKSKGFGDLLAYAKPFFGIKELEIVFKTFNGIIDVGATDAYCSNTDEFQSSLKLFKNFKNSFLILPSRDMEISTRTLEKRLICRYKNHPFKNKILNSYLAKNKEILESLAEFNLANNVIYSNNRSLDEICEEIIFKTNNVSLLIETQQVYIVGNDPVIENVGFTRFGKLYNSRRVNGVIFQDYENYKDPAAPDSLEFIADLYKAEKLPIL